MFNFPENISTALPVFYRTYSRRNSDKIESWQDVCKRIHKGLVTLGKLTKDESELLWKMHTELKCLPSGRWLWVGGTPWLEEPQNFYGAYNCTSTDVIDWESFALMMNLTMVGCGAGSILEADSINQLPPICNHLDVRLVGKFGDAPKITQ